MWIVAACLSAAFAGLTAILSKCGVKNVNSNVATAVRTSVVLVFAWVIVFATGAYSTLAAVSATSWIFLILSGLATGASWLCYYYAIQKGQVSVVVPIDKLSILITVFFSLIVFKEKLTWKAWLGLAILTAGTVCMAVFT
ncbi:MAG: EamA family transporter [Clostridiales bacterium]|nr:EamA family transporter [Clostridiales bacterium]